MSTDEIIMALPSRYGRNHMWWLAALLVVGLFGAVYAGNYWQSVNSFIPETIPSQSTYNRRESGYSGFYELARKMHLDARQWQSAYRDLGEMKIHGTLIIISPWDTPSPNEIAMIQDWVKEGNGLVYMDDFSLPSSRLLLDRLGLSAIMLKKPAAVHAPMRSDIDVAHKVGLLRGDVDSLIEGGTQLLQGATSAVLTMKEEGAGSCLISTMPELCANRYLGDAQYKGNFQFLINWLSNARGPIYFDEKSHGYTSGNNVVFFILKSPVGFVILQMLILLGVAFLSLNQRFGPAIPVSNARKISNLEFIKGLAAGYQRARARDTAWAMIYLPFKGRLCKALAVAPHESIERLAEAWSEQSGRKQDECETFLGRAQAALDKRKLDDNELQALIADCDRLAAGMRQLQPAGKIMGT
jgi:hypothetical protein